MTPPPARRGDRRYGWLRLYNDLLIHGKWDAVSAMTCVDKCRVICIAEWLMIEANKGRPRSSIAEFKAYECSARLSIPLKEVRRVYKCLVDIGWIDQEHLSTWHERQPDSEDFTAAERQKRRREKIRQQNQQPADAVTRDNRDVTHRLDKKERKKGETDLGPSGETMTWEEAEAWRQAKLPLGPVAIKGRGGR
jgi:hypothetical protein